MKASNYYLAEEGEQTGPFTFADLRRMWRDGTVTDQVLFWKEGTEDWEPLGNIVEKLEPNLPSTAPSAEARYAEHLRRSALMASKMESEKRLLPAILLLLLFGGLGIHQFYLGHLVRGLFYLICLGFACVGGDASIVALMILGIFLLLDFIMIIVAGVRDEKGLPVKRWT